MRAETARPVEDDPATAPDAPQANRQSAPPPPDLDALAQQVYDILRRRIAVEAQRVGL